MGKKDYVTYKPFNNFKLYEYMNTLIVDKIGNPKTSMNFASQCVHIYQSCKYIDFKMYLNCCGVH